MEIQKKNLVDSLKLATTLFVSVPFLAGTSMATAERRVKKTDIRDTKTGIRFSQPGLRVKSPKKRFKKTGIRAVPDTRPNETGLRSKPTGTVKAPDRNTPEAPVTQVK